MFTREEKHLLWEGEVIDVAGTRYQLCPGCHRAIKMNGFFGSLHVCADEAERETNRQIYLQRISQK
jgi:hypothetical protein